MADIVLPLSPSVSSAVYAKKGRTRIIKMTLAMTLTSISAPIFCAASVRGLRWDTAATPHATEHGVSTHACKPQVARGHARTHFSALSSRTLKDCPKSVTRLAMVASTPARRSDAVEERARRLCVCMVPTWVVRRLTPPAARAGATEPRRLPSRRSVAFAQHDRRASLMCIARMAACCSRSTAA